MGRMVSYTIDTTTYRKDTHLPLGQGYGMRFGGTKPTTIVIHTTNSAQQNTTFEHEARYLWNSHDVSAHYLNGKADQIAQILPPDLAAWHAGGKQANGTWTAMPAYDNNHSIGIENHVSVGEAWTGIQRDSLTWLVRWLMALYGIQPAQIETHRAIALPGPNIRKHDPEAWPDASFYAWRDQLLTPSPSPSPPPKRYRVKHRYITQRKEDNGPPIVRELAPGEELLVDAWYTNNRVHFADGSGFGDLADLESIEG
jgi:hypothetical protein